MRRWRGSMSQGYCASGFPVTVAGFAGGETGKLLRRNKAGRGLVLSCLNAARCCYGLTRQPAATIDRTVTRNCTERSSALLKKLETRMPEFSPYAFPAFCREGRRKFYANHRIAHCGIQCCSMHARKGNNSVTGVPDAEDQCEENAISAENLIWRTGRKILSAFPVVWLAVTDGAGNGCSPQTSGVLRSRLYRKSSARWSRRRVSHHGARLAKT